MIFKKREPYLEVGTITARLGMKRFYFGDSRWEWLRTKKRFLFRPYLSLNPHVCMIGTSGSGKSNACKLLVKALIAKGAKVSILDPHGEYSEFAYATNFSIYDASRSSINAFELDGLSEREKAGELLSMFKRTFKMGDVQGYTLYKCILYTYKVCKDNNRVPNIKGLLFTIKVFMRNADPKELSVLRSLENRLSMLDTEGFSGSCPIEKILSENSVIVLSNLHIPEAQSIYMESFLRKIYTKMLSMRKSGSPKFYVVIDEAAKIRGSDILSRIAAEGRKYGFGIIALSQRAKEMDSGLRSNSALFASFYQREPEELNYTANYISGGNEGFRFMEVKKALRNLQRGSAVILESSRKEPLIVGFDAASESIEGPVSAILSMGPDAARHDDLMSKTLALGIKGDHAEEFLARAVEKGLVASHALQDCGAYSGTWYMRSVRNTPEHDISLSIISRKLSESGIRNRIYNSTNGPDIIACGNIAIEYETGSKSVESTAAMIKRRTMYAKCIIIASSANSGLYSSIAQSFSINEFMKMNDEELRSALSVQQNPRMKTISA